MKREIDVMLGFEKGKLENVGFVIGGVVEKRRGRGVVCFRSFCYVARTDTTSPISIHSIFSQFQFLFSLFL
jgi:hypothetical protein